MNNRAYSLIEVKELNDEKRVLRGIATSPRPDRIGDIVEPLGVKVAADIPLFLYHEHTQIVGRAKFGKPTVKGIPFEASIPNVIEEGTLKNRVDEAWQMVKYNLITAVSIGFKPVAEKIERLKSGGLRFVECEVLELSLCPVPMHPEAVIEQFKSMSDESFVRLFSIDREHLPSAGNGVSAGGTPGADALAKPKAAFRGPVKLIPRKYAK